MATLVLSTIGTALGGPVGGVLGSLIGQGIDRQILGPGPRRGPRLNDLSVQTSSYGTPIPRVYGKMRVAGSVVWATELTETSEVQGDTIVYSYSVSFAVALSSRPANGIGRIWADGKLLRGAAGDFKVKTGFRYYPGSEDQPVDPLIASAEGDCPAFRGLSIAVFEDLQLAEFGNRIPFLTFELIADAQEPSLGSVLYDASDGLIAADVLETIGGYAAYGSGKLLAVQTLVDHFAIALREDDGRVKSASTTAIQFDRDEQGCAAGDRPATKNERRQVPAGSLPRSFTLTYYDSSRDYQAGQARADANSAGGVGETVELPVVLSAERARALAETQVARRWAERDRVTLRLPPDRLSIEPGTFVNLEDGSRWRVQHVVLEDFVVRIELARGWEAGASAPADAGSHLPAPDRVVVPTVLALLDLPDLGLRRHDLPALYAAAAQPSGPWRQIPLRVSVNGEVRTTASARREAIIGTALTMLGDAPASILDLKRTLEVELSDPEHWLESRNDDALIQGANLAQIGRELIQFGSAVAIAPRRFRLSKLLRGRRGTEWATSTHVIGDQFILIEPGAIQPIDLPLEALGSIVTVQPAGLADDIAEDVQAIASGEALRPPSPVHLSAERQPDGSLAVRWVRRSRGGWAWVDGIDAPLGESVERYLVQLQGNATTVGGESMVPQFTFAPAQLAAAGSGAATLSVTQIGDFAQSRTVTLTLTV